MLSKFKFERKVNKHCKRKKRIPAERKQKQNFSKKFN